MKRSKLIPVPELSARYTSAWQTLYLHRRVIEKRGENVVYGMETTSGLLHLTSWFLNFVQADLSKPSPREWQDLQDELVVFSLPPDLDREMASIGDIEHPPGRSEIEKIQKELKRGIAKLFDSSDPGAWRIPNLQVTSVLVRLRSGRVVRSYRSKSLSDRFLMAATDLLERVGDRIRCCPKCGRLFSAVKRQSYCTQRCSQSVRTRKYRERHRGALREKRQERNYAKGQAEKARQAALQMARGRFFEFLKAATKNALTSGEQTRLRPILRKIGGWKTVEMWETKLKAGASLKEIWEGLSNDMKQIFSSV